MEFKKFSSIENISRIKFIHSMQEQGLADGEFVISEKCHGVNFQLVFNGLEFKAGKRSSFLKLGVSFFNWAKVSEDNYGKIKGIFNILKNNNPDIEEIVIYGEIFGGLYPHPDVNLISNATKVQKGIWYSPDNLFYAFDIKANGKYLTVDEANELFEKVGMFYAKTLFRGTLQECLNYPNMFQTKIPEWLGLPPIDNNICEGVVIRPVEPRFLYGNERVILKNKNEKWTEKAHATNKKSRVEIKFSKELNKACQETYDLIVENRLRNVLSKFGKVTQGDFGKIVGLMSKDAIEEYCKDNQDKIDSLEKDERKRYNKAINKEASNLIRKNFVNIIDGEL